MVFKSYMERLDEKHDLVDLIRKTGFVDYDPTTFKLPKPVEMMIGSAPYKFLRKLGSGIEIFCFKHPGIWHSTEQMDGRGLKYFCLATPERISLDLMCSTEISKWVESGNGSSVYNWVANSGPQTKLLNLDVMFPDKWDHMALELLILYAENHKKSKLEKK